MTYYEAVCDRCVAKDDEGDYAAWAEPEMALYAAQESEWELINSRLLCPLCHVWSENLDELVEAEA